MEILLNYNGKIYYSIEAYQTSGIRTGGYLSELHEIQLDDILKCITTNQIGANCYTTIQSISDFCSNNNFLLYKVNIECTKSYKIISNSSNSIEICLYDNDMNLLNIVPVMSDNNCTGTIINYLASGTYYLKLAFTELSNSGIITTTYQATWPSASGLSLLFSPSGAHRAPPPSSEGGNRKGSGCKTNAKRGVCPACAVSKLLTSALRRRQPCSRHRRRSRHWGRSGCRNCRRSQRRERPGDWPGRTSSRRWRRRPSSAPRRRP